MSLEHLDLNLLRTLDVLLAERSVSRAARRLDRSQPAVSHALARLRDAFDDPLLVRQGRGLVPTPRAEALAEPLARLLGDLGRLVERAPDFAPATSRRAFRLACPPLLAPLLPHVLDAMGREAPQASLEVLDGQGRDDAGRADVVLGPLPDEAPDLQARRLGVVTQAVIARADHPVGSRPWDLAAWLAWPHVLVRTGDRRPSLVDRRLEALGRTRRIGVVVPGLLLAPHVVARSDLFFTGPRQVLAPLVGPLGLVLREPPLELPGVPVAAMWQARLAHDPGHRWFRTKIVDALASHLQPPRRRP